MKPMEIEGKVPKLDEVEFTPEMKAFWDVMGVWIEAARKQMDEPMVISLLMSRVTRELRRQYGLDAAQAMLRIYADTMGEAALYDDQAPGKA